MKSTISPTAAEASEYEALYSMTVNMDADARRKAGVASARLGGGLALSFRDDPTRFWTRALGLGCSQPVTGDLIRQVTDFYREQEVARATIQLVPAAIPADWDGISAEANLSEGPKLAKLAVEADVAAARAVSDLPGELRVGLATSAQRAEWTATMTRIFDMTDETSVAMIAAIVDEPGWYPYAVWDGDQVIATAALHANGDTAQFFGGSTLPEYRGRGAQTALIAARARAAQAAGCRWLVAETGVEESGEPNVSMRNLRRVGFEVLYERTGWTWGP